MWFVVPQIVKKQSIYFLRVKGAANLGISCPVLAVKVRRIKLIGNSQELKIKREDLILNTKDSHILINLKYRPITILTSKELYTSIITKETKSPTAVESWIKIYPFSSYVQPSDAS